LNHCLHELLLFLIIHLLIPSHHFQLVHALLAELFLYLLYLIGLKTGQVVIEGGDEVDDLSGKVEVLLVALLQDLPHHLHALELAGHRVHIELYFHVVVHSGGSCQDLQQLSVLVHLQKHVLDAVEA
jgi:hypothetical protein